MPESRVASRVFSSFAADTGDYRVEAMVIVCALLAIVAVWFAAVMISRQEVAETIAATQKSNANIARVVEEHTVRVLNESDHILRLLKNEYEQRGKVLDLPNFHDSLRPDSALHVNSVIARSDGMVIMSSTRDFRPVNLADREHFMAHVMTDSDKPFISKPILARVAERWTFALTRRINLPGGAFGGIVSLNLDPFYFTSLYRQIDLGEKGIIALTGLDGIMRARLDTGKSNLGQDVSKSEVFRHIEKSPTGSYVAPSAVDGTPRIFSYRVVRGYPLLVNVGVAQSSVLGAVWERRRTYFSVAAAISVLLALSATLLIAAAYRRRRHVAALADGERRLNASRQLFLQQQAALAGLARDDVLSIGELQPVFEKAFDGRLKLASIRLYETPNCWADVSHS